MITERKVIIMKIKVFNEYAIQLFITDLRHIVVSVRSPKSQKVFLPFQSSRLGALFLEFHDIDERCLNIKERKNCEVCGGSGYIEEYHHIEGGRCFGCNREGMDLRLFCENHAKLILSFVETYKNKVDLIAVNCEAGRSRSVGISAALSIILNGLGSDMYYFKRYCPNMLVYRKILDTYYETKESNS